MYSRHPSSDLFDNEHSVPQHAEALPPEPSRLRKESEKHHLMLFDDVIENLCAKSRLSQADGFSIPLCDSNGNQLLELREQGDRIRMRRGDRLHEGTKDCELGRENHLMIELLIQFAAPLKNGKKAGRLLRRPVIFRTYPEGRRSSHAACLWTVLVNPDLPRRAELTLGFG